jgi:hypothetical protein
MPDTEADELWNSSAPFENKSRPATKTRKSKPGSEAEIILPEADKKFEPEPDTLGELIDGSEDDISNLEEQVAPAPVAISVDRDSRSRAVAAVAAAQKRSREPMAEQKTKAESIRDEITRRKAAGEANIRPRDIIATLAEQGVTVTSPQVSVTLRDWSKQPANAAANPAKAKKTAAPAPRAAVAAPVPRPAVTSQKRAMAKVSAATPKSAPAANEPSYAALAAAAAFVQNNGGLDTARGLLDAYARLFNPAG